MMLNRVFIVLLLVRLLRQAQSFPDGAPVTACLSMYPRHSGSSSGSVDRRYSALPYNITLWPEVFHPREVIEIKISCKTLRQLRGIQMGARRISGNPLLFVGQFISFPADKIKLLSCFPGFHNMITQKNSDGMHEIELQWKAPDQYIGDIQFRTTFVEDYDTFWVSDQIILRASNESIPPVPPKYPGVKAVYEKFEFYFDLCGQRSSCFFYPQFCNYKRLDRDYDFDCVAVSFEYRDDTDDFHVQMAINTYVDYVAIGFSHDQMMGDDATITCVNADLYSGIKEDSSSVQQGLNVGHDNERQLVRSLSKMKLHFGWPYAGCEFLMSSKLPVYRLKQENGTDKYIDEIFDTDDGWHILLAWGMTLEGSNTPAKHIFMPAVSFSKIKIKEKDIYYGSAFHPLVRLHGCLMIIAWVLLAGVVTVMSTHYRDWLSEKRLFGTKIWFQVHRGCAILLVLFTVAALTANFVHFGPGIRRSAGAHAYVGLVAFTFVIMQAIGGYLRPDEGSKRRSCFRWVHRILGQITHILAAVTIFLAFKMNSTTHDLRNMEKIAVLVWVGIQILWHLVFTVYRLIKKFGPRISCPTHCSKCMTQNMDISMKIQCCKCLCLCEVNSDDKTQDPAELQNLLGDGDDDHADDDDADDDHADNVTEHEQAEPHVRNDSDDPCVLSDDDERNNQQSDHVIRGSESHQPGKKLLIFESVLLGVYIFFLVLCAAAIMTCFLLF